MHILVATEREVVVVDVERGTATSTRGINGRPTCVSADPLVQAGRGVALNATACSEAMIAGAHGTRPASRVG